MPIPRYRSVPQMLTYLLHLEVPQLLLKHFLPTQRHLLALLMVDWAKSSYFTLCPPFRQYHHQQALRGGHLAHHRLSQMVGPQNGVNTSKNGTSQTLQYKINTKQSIHRWFFSKYASEPEAPRWDMPTVPVGPSLGGIPGKAGTDSKIFALIPPSKYYPDGRVPLGAHYSDKTDENYIVERVNHRLKLPPSLDGNVVMSWVPLEGREVISQKFAVWPDEKGLADVVFTTRAGEKENEPVPKLLFPGMSFSTDPGVTFFLVELAVC
jgi:hypothetical protein